MVTIIYISGYISHFFKVSQNRREEEDVGSCPKKGRFLLPLAGHCSAVSTSGVRTLTGRGRLSGLKMVLCQTIFNFPAHLQRVCVSLTNNTLRCIRLMYQYKYVIKCHTLVFCFCKLYNVLFITAHFRHSKLLYCLF